jgi:hypothetical protein
MRRLTSLLLLCLSLTAAAGDTLSVLFIGNSHTYVNDLPGLVESLAVAGNRIIATEMTAFGGYALMEHAVNDSTRRSIARGGWDYVVLQEQSQIPVIPYWRYNGMYPASRTLDSLIRAVGAGTMFYMTWGWKYGGLHIYQGDTSMFFPDYFEMQESVRVAYEEIALKLGAPIAPVGMAWARARRIDSLVDLWQLDSCHATLKGAYLAACVFYARLFSADPTGLTFTAGLDSAEARFFQHVAWETVYGVGESRGADPAPSPMLRVRPNPATGRATLEYVGSATGRVNLLVHDSEGRRVRSLASPASWDGRDERGRLLASGTYFVTAGAVSARLVLLR